MPPIDELLRAEGERWRAEVDAHGDRVTRATSRAADPGSTARRVLGWSASLAAAAAAVALLGALIAHGGSSDENAGSDFSRAATAGGAAAAASPAAPQASCAGPSLRIVTPRAATPKVAQGQVLVVQGTRYVSDCIDTGPAGALPTSPAVGVVDLKLSTADLRTVTVTQAHPRGVTASFTVRVRVPADAAVGPATISDGRGHRVRLTVVAR